MRKSGTAIGIIVSVIFVFALSGCIPAKPMGVGRIVNVLRRPKPKVPVKPPVPVPKVPIAKVKPSVPVPKVPVAVVKPRVVVPKVPVAVVKPPVVAPRVPAVRVRPPAVAPRVAVAGPPVVRTRPSYVRVRRSRHLDARIDAYDDDALNDYYKFLKLNVEHLSTFASITAEQLNAMKRDARNSLFALLWLPIYSGRMETAKIELESWPLSARQEGWDILGKRIKKYNKLFYKYRDMILENNAYDQTTKDRLAEIELITEETLMAAN